MVAFSVSLCLAITECRSERSSEIAEPSVDFMSAATDCRSDRLGREEVVAPCDLLVLVFVSGSLPGECRVGEVEAA